MIRAVHDVKVMFMNKHVFNLMSYIYLNKPITYVLLLNFIFKGIDMGSGLVRYKAEVDFDGRELTRSYLDKQDLEMMLEEVRNMKNINEMESFLLKHGENIGMLIVTSCSIRGFSVRYLTKLLLL